MEEIEVKSCFVAVKMVFHCIFGFSTLKNFWDALIVQKLVIKLAIQ